MKSNKLKLADLKVQSFVTTLEGKMGTVKGGSGVGNATTPGMGNGNDRNGDTVLDVDSNNGARVRSAGTVLDPDANRLNGGTILDVDG